MISIKCLKNSKAQFSIGSALETNAVHLQQVHGASFLKIEDSSSKAPAEGDALWTVDPKIEIAVKVADCTAILMSGLQSGQPFVAAVHAGWRGTAKGILNAVAKEIGPNSRGQAWFSPSICQEHFEVGAEVIEALGKNANKFSKPEASKFLLDLKAFQQEEFRRLFPNFQIYSSSLCTFCQADLYSFRRAKRELPKGDRHFASIRLVV